MQFPAIDPAMPARFGPMSFSIYRGMVNLPFLPQTSSSNGSRRWSLQIGQHRESKWDSMSVNPCQCPKSQVRLKRKKICCRTQFFFPFVPLHVLLFPHERVLATPCLQPSPLHCGAHILFTGREVEPRRRESAMAEHALHLGELHPSFVHTSRQAMTELVR